MNLLLLIVLLLETSTARFASAPATSPAALTEYLDAGRVRYAVPTGWSEVRRGDDGMSARYRPDDGTGTLVVTVTPQPQAVPPEAAARMGLLIGKQIRDAADKAGHELLDGPRVEPDGRFFLVVHDRLRLRGDGGVVDRMQLYRTLGTNLVHVLSLAQTDDENEARAVHAAARQLLAGARIGPGPRPRSFPKTGVKVTVPADWREERRDDPNGLVATFRPPNDADGRRIVVRSRVIPKTARGDAARRDALVEQMVAAERTTPPLPDGAVTGATEALNDERFVRTTRSSLTAGDTSYRLVTRYRVIGDVVLGISSVVPATRADVERCERDVDEFALAIAAIER